MSKFFSDDRGGIFCDITSGSEKLTGGIKRVYMCKNTDKGIIRGFHYHEFEEKLFYVPQGTIKFVLIKMIVEQAMYLSEHTHENSFYADELDEWEITVKTLSEHSHEALYVPAGYANGWISLEDDSILIGCSNKTIEESVKDDIKINPDLDVFDEYWQIKNR